MCLKSIKKVITRTEFKLFLTFLIVYIFFINWYGWNEESNFALTRSLVEEGRFEIDNFHNLTGDRSVYKEHYYSDKSPGLSLLAVPIYNGWKFIYYNMFPKSFIKSHKSDTKYVTTFQHPIGIYTHLNPGFFTLNSMLIITLFTSSVFSALTSILIYKLTKEFVNTQGIIIAFAYALGTLAFPYALHFMSHATGAFFAFLAFYLLFITRVTGERSNYKRYILAGLSLGFAIVIENILVITIPLFLVYAFLLDIKKIVWKKYILFISAFIIGILPLLLYNYSIFGSPLEFASTYIDREIYRSAYTKRSFGFISYKDETNINGSRFVKYSLFSSIEMLVKYFHLIPGPNPYVFIRLLFGPYRGLVFYSPILILSFIGLYWMRKKYKLEATFISLMLIFLLFFISMRSNWWGGYCFGNRYLTTIVPFLFVPILYASSRVNFKLLGFPLIVLSIFINLLGLQPAEDFAYNWNIMGMRLDWVKKQNSLKIFYNPLKERYWATFFEHGPRSPLFENLSNGHTSIDIRMPALSKGAGFPFSEFYIPFLCIIPLLFILSLIWYREIFSRINKVLKKYKEM